jgi:REP element-mobilizing transposase RayT
MPPTDPTILAYFITWTTYGTWLPGDFRGWIKKNLNGIQKPSLKLQQESRARMAEDAIELTISQRAIVEKTIHDHCTIRNWRLHAVNARTNHVHIIVTAGRDPDEVMNQLKAWCSRKLSDAAGLTTPVAKKAGRRHWFTEDGDKQRIDNEEFLRKAIKYVLEGQ